MPVRKKNEPISEYEKRRQENIQRNQEMLKVLDLVGANPHITTQSDEVSESSSGLLDVPKVEPKVVKRKLKNEGSAKPAKRKRVEIPAIPIATRTSRRLRGEKADLVVPAISEDSASESFPDPELLSNSGLMSAEEFFTKEIYEKAIKVTGHYTGWINPELVDKYGLESSAKDAWEKNGGGKFSFKDPLGIGKIKKSSIPAGWSEAKFVSSKLFKKNPNSYFYRNLEPGVAQWTGDWDEEEKSTFLKVCKELGCGDKWGLFSSYLPHRVGYQCR
ncbi:hypothetical protein H4219_002177 [Mycoemilia scoparia]|uniref:Myb-like domain-containing protein n=1 Tax=Mycoemilia scoparia TaxID=417184 RepID=A0A9W8A1U4_9FUNG|nr:hypothetical protein H4219_002177 [Mycoemilia scoparia]